MLECFQSRIDMTYFLTKHQCIKLSVLFSNACLVSFGKLEVQKQSLTINVWYFMEIVQTLLDL